MFRSGRKTIFRDCSVLRCFAVLQTECWSEQINTSGSERTLSECVLVRTYFLLQEKANKKGHGPLALGERATVKLSIQEYEKAVEMAPDNKAYQEALRDARLTWEADFD